MIFFSLYSISFRSVNALSSVIESIYSISAPIGIPLAILVTLIFKPSNIFFIYKLVVSPSILGLTAIITSLKLPSFMLLHNVFSDFQPSYYDSIGY